MVRKHQAVMSDKQREPRLAQVGRHMKSDLKEGGIGGLQLQEEAGGALSTRAAVAETSIARGAASQHYMLALASSWVGSIRMVTLRVMRRL
jgi:hypothetical protein